jgi:hypothetical protein
MKINKKSIYTTTIKNNEEKMITIYYKMVTVYKYRAFIQMYPQSWRWRVDRERTTRVKA